MPLLVYSFIPSVRRDPLSHHSVVLLVSVELADGFLVEFGAGLGLAGHTHAVSHHELGEEIK